MAISAADWSSQPGEEEPIEDIRGSAEEEAQTQMLSIHVSLRAYKSCKSRLSIRMMQLRKCECVVQYFDVIQVVGTQAHHQHHLLQNQAAIRGKRVGV